MPSDSQCLICSRFFYGEEHENCPRCGGLCAKYPNENLRYMERHIAKGSFITQDLDMLVGIAR